MRRLCPGRASAACCGVYAIARSPGLGRFGLVREWYQPHLERLYDYAPSRAGDLVQLEQIAMGYPNRERFLSEVTLDPPDVAGAEASVDSTLSDLRQILDRIEAAASLPDANW